MKCGSDTIAGTIERVTFHNPENGLTVVKTAIEGHRDLDSMGKTRQERIASGGSGQRVVRKIMVFLHSYGVGTARAVHIDETYEDDANGTPFTLIC